MFLFRCHMHGAKPNLIIKLSYCYSLHLVNRLKDKDIIRTVNQNQNQVKMCTTTINSTVYL